MPSPTVGTEASTTVASTSNAVNVSSLHRIGNAHVAAITNFPTATGSRLYVATSAGTATSELHRHVTSTTSAGHLSSVFTGVNLVSGSGHAVDRRCSHPGQRAG